METNLKSLQIDPSSRRRNGYSGGRRKWIVLAVALLVAVGAFLAFNRGKSAVEVETMRLATNSSGAGREAVVLNATGYIVAHHEIEVAAKVVGRVSWIGVEKGDRVQSGQELVRLEDEEYRAQLRQAEGQLANQKARLAAAQNGSRPEEIQLAGANLEQAKADLADAKTVLDRTKSLAATGVLPTQSLDTAKARFDAATARVASLTRTFELARIGPRQEDIDAIKGQVEQAAGLVEFARTQLANTIIRSPQAGTILERAVEKGEFVTNGFVGDKGAKGFVAALADLNDLQVELDISQNDFAKLGMGQRGIVTTDAFPDRKYKGEVAEISPKADRQKATVQVKVKVLEPDQYLRPEMNASVAFVAEGTPLNAATQPSFAVPRSAVADNAVFVVLGGKAVRRDVKSALATTGEMLIHDGLSGGEELIVNPPANLKSGDAVEIKTKK